MSYIVWFIYFGGAGAFPDRKLGFFRRVLWPFELGERIAEHVFGHDTCDSSDKSGGAA